jgi:hypothetical protein
MPEKKESVEDKIATSSGSETEVMSQTLEDEADQIIKDMYPDVNLEDEKTEKEDKDDEAKDDEAKDDKAKDEDIEGDDKDDDEDVDEDNKDDEVDGKGNESIDELLSKLDKSDKRVKDTRKEFTKKSQELSDIRKKNEELEDTVFSLRSKIDDLASNQQTKAEDKKTEKAIKKETVALSSQIEEIRKVDPDLAKAMEPIVIGLTSEIDSLKTELKTNEERQAEKEKLAEEQKEQDAADAHFAKLDKAHDGWEDMMKTPEFEKYLKGLSPREKRLAILDLKGGTAEDIIEIFDDFVEVTKEPEGDDKIKKAKGMINPNLRKSKEINRGVKKMLYTRSEIAAMDPLDYAKNEKAIDEAMVKGLIENR